MQKISPCNPVFCNIEGGIGRGAWLIVRFLPQNENYELGVTCPSLDLLSSLLLVIYITFFFIELLHIGQKTTSLRTLET